MSTSTSPANNRYRLLGGNLELFFFLAFAANKDSHLQSNLLLLTSSKLAGTCVSCSLMKFPFCLLHHDSKFPITHFVLIAVLEKTFTASSLYWALLMTINLVSPITTPLSISFEQRVSFLSLSLSLLAVAQHEQVAGFLYHLPIPRDKSKHSWPGLCFLFPREGDAAMTASQFSLPVRTTLCVRGQQCPESRSFGCQDNIWIT